MPANKSSDPEKNKPPSVNPVSFFAPLVLIVIACLQLAIALTTHLSPWKGGGFGMFSTIASPSSRIIRVYLVANGTKIPVQVPEQYRKLAAEIRTWPNQKRTDELARALSGNTWATYEILPTQERYRMLHKKYFPASNIISDTAAEHMNLHLKRNLHEIFDRMQWVYMVKRGEMTNHPLSFEKVEVECLQLDFDKAKNKLVLNLVVKAQENRYERFSK